jgi:hypothetical protein
MGQIVEGLNVIGTPWVGAQCEELLHTFTTKICTHNKNPAGSGTTM